MADEWCRSVPRIQTHKPRPQKLSMLNSTNRPQGHPILSLFDILGNFSNFFFFSYELFKKSYTYFKCAKALFQFIQRINLQTPEMVREGWSRDYARQNMRTWGLTGSSPCSAPAHCKLQKHLVPPVPELFQGSLCAQKKENSFPWSALCPTSLHVHLLFFHRLPGLRGWSLALWVFQSSPEVLQVSGMVQVSFLFFIFSSSSSLSWSLSLSAMELYFLTNFFIDEPLVSFLRFHYYKHW